MIIYKCILSGDEMFSDVFAVTEKDAVFEVEGKIVTRTDDIDDSLIGGNASAEEASEGTIASTSSGVNIILNHKLQEISHNKKSYTAYIKEYMKTIKAHLQETKPDRVEGFTNDVQADVKKILQNIKNYQFFCGESMNVDGAIGLLDFREDGITPYMIFFKDGLEVEKV